MSYFNFTPLTKKAEAFACDAHQGQFRKYTRAPYIEHPRRVAKRALDLGAAALLHDVIEDCGITGPELHKKFGWQVTSLVLELTNPSKGIAAPRAMRKEKDRRHLAQCSRWAKIIKLLDRIDNLNEMDAKGDSGFARLYVGESQLLLDECLRGIHPELEAELQAAIQTVGALAALGDNT